MGLKDLLPLLQWSAIGAVLASCSAPVDREAIKAAQIASIGDGSDRVAGETLKDYFWHRSGWIIPKSNLASPIVATGSIATFPFDPINGGARAAALTEDGYYLTAAHVLKDEPPVLVGPTMKPYEGRVVKAFPKQDLALLKFPIRTVQHFHSWQTEPESGEAIYSAAPQGVEPFEVKGTVKSFASGGKDGESRTIQCKLPAMAGNSGTPVANTKGELVGVITGSWHARLTGKQGTTEVKMLKPSVLNALITADRQSKAQSH